METVSVNLGLIQILLIGMATVLTPAIVAIISAVMTQRATRETWDRQDKMAARVDAAQNRMNNTLDTVHKLVNSSLTASKQSEYDALARDLASMQENVDLKVGLGKKPTQEILNAIATAKDKISLLRTELDERQRQAKLIEAQEASQRAADGSTLPTAPVKVEIVESQKPVPVKIKE